MTCKLRNELEKIALANNIKLKVVNWRAGRPGGRWTPGHITIYHRRDLDRTWYLNVLFHELGHQYCYDHGLWNNYHDINRTVTDSTYRRIALKAERFVDRIGEKELKKYDPSVKYTAAYYTKYGVDYLYAHHLDSTT